MYDFGTPIYLLCFKVVTKPSLENDLFTTAKDTNVTKKQERSLIVRGKPDLS